MKTGVTAKQYVIYAILLVAGSFYLFYVLWFSDALQRKQKVEDDIAKLKTEIQSLETYYVPKDQYLSNIDENNQIIATEVDKNLPELSHKDLIAYLEYAATGFDMNVPNMVISDSEKQEELTYTFDAERDSVTPIKRNMSLTYEMKYGKLKDYLSKVKESDLHVYITTVSASLDNSTGKISGVIGLTARGMIGSNKEDHMYTEDPININNVKEGVTNLFGSYSENPIEDKANSSNPQNNSLESVSEEEAGETPIN